MENQTSSPRTPNFLKLCGNLISSHGFSCPRVSNLWLKTTSPREIKLEAFCGPKNTIGIYEQLHYGIHPEKFEVSIRKKPGIPGAGCE
jgi:hypothetical protein